LSCVKQEINKLDNDDWSLRCCLACLQTSKLGIPGLNLVNIGFGSAEFWFGLR
jgi:hypothetical protein